MAPSTGSYEHSYRTFNAHPHAFDSNCVYYQTYSHLSPLDSLINYLACIIVANFITGIAYILIKKLKPHLSTKFPLYLGFLITAFVLLSLYIAPIGVKTSPSIADALALGLAQSFTLLPGISRLAVTVAAGIWLGMAPASAFVFSLTLEFFLMVIALPKAFYDTKRHRSPLYTATLSQILALFFSTVISYRLLEGVFMLTQNRLLGLFGWYMLIIAYVSWKKIGE